MRVRRHWLVAVMCVFAIASLVAVPAGAQEDSNDLAPIRVGYQPEVDGGALVAIGIREGFFEEEGLEVEAIKFTSGPPQVEAMFSGDLDVGEMGIGPLALLMDGSARVLIPDDLNIKEIILAREGTGIEPGDPSTLEGKTVIFPPGGNQEFLLRAALDSVGLTFDDIDAQSSTPDGAAAAFAAGRVDAISIHDPYTEELAAEPGVFELISSYDLENFALPAVWSASEDFVEENPDIAIRFIRAWAKANDYRIENQTEMLPFVSEFVDTPVRALEPQLEKREFGTSEEIRQLIEDGGFAANLETANELLVGSGLMEEVYPVDRYFPEDLVLEAFTEESEGAAAPRTDDEGINLGLVAGVAAIALAVLIAGAFVWRRRFA